MVCRVDGNEVGCLFDGRLFIFVLCVFVRFFFVSFVRGFLADGSFPLGCRTLSDTSFRLVARGQVPFLVKMGVVGGGRLGLAFVAFIPMRRDGWGDVLWPLCVVAGGLVDWAVGVHVGRVDGEAGEGQIRAARVHVVSAPRAPAAVHLADILLFASIQVGVGVHSVVVSAPDVGAVGGGVAGLSALVTLEVAPVGAVAAPGRVHVVGRAAVKADLLGTARLEVSSGATHVADGRLQATRVVSVSRPVAIVASVNVKNSLYDCNFLLQM